MIHAVLTLLKIINLLLLRLKSIFTYILYSSYFLRRQQKRQYPYSRKTFINSFELNLKTYKNLYKGEFVCVLTDIVDSTYLWNKYTFLMREIIMIHHSLGTRLIYENNGYEVKKEGDSYFAVFADIESARNFAIIFMNEIDRRCKELGFFIKLKIGIDKGDCFLVKNGDDLRFYGDGLNRALALCNNSKPGEINMLGKKVLKFEN